MGIVLHCCKTFAFSCHAMPSKPLSAGWWSFGSVFSGTSFMDEGKPQAALRCAAHWDCTSSNWNRQTQLRHAAGWISIANTQNSSILLGV